MKLDQFKSYSRRMTKAPAFAKMLQFFLHHQEKKKRKKKKDHGSIIQDFQRSPSCNSNTFVSISSCQLEYSLYRPSSFLGYSNRTCLGMKHQDKVTANNSVLEVPHCYSQSKRHFMQKARLSLQLQKISSVGTHHYHKSPDFLLQNKTKHCLRDFLHII